MSRRCELTAKGPQVGHKVSHSNIKTKRRFLPNLLNVTLMSDALGRSVRLRISANALKSVDHRGGLDAFLAKASDDDAFGEGAAAEARDREEAGRSEGRLSLTPVSVCNARPYARRRRAKLQMAGHFAFAMTYCSSVNCSSSVRWTNEKLSSEISVSTSAPSAARCTDSPSMLSI